MMLHDTAASAIKVTAVFFIEWVPSLCKGKSWNACFTPVADAAVLPCVRLLAAS